MSRFGFNVLLKDRTVVTNVKVSLTTRPPC